MNTDTPVEISQFGHHFYTQILGYAQDQVDKHLIVAGNESEKYPIGPLWTSSFAARDAAYNHFFLDSGIHLIENGERFATNRQLMFMGFNSFWGLLRRKFF